MLSRRAFLSATASGALAAAATTTLGACSSGGDNGKHGDHSGDAMNGVRSNYGSLEAQFGELHRPEHATHDGTIVIIHGGFWQQQYDLSLGRPLARDLAAHGYTCWNLEYRRVGDPNGGGWPATFADVAAGIDHLAELTDVDTDRVVAVGHSAGGQLAVWALGRGALPSGEPGHAPRVPLTAAVSQAGVLDLAVAATTGVGGTAEDDLMGGSPTAVPQRYRYADPIRQIPLRQPVYCVHSRADQNVPFSQSTTYVDAARKTGAPAQLREVQGDHFTLIDPTSAAWRDVRDALPNLMHGRLPG